MVLVSEENISGINTHFRKYHIGGIDTFGIISPITTIYVPAASLLSAWRVNWCGYIRLA